MTKQPLIVILGETASGKSALGLALARKFDGEIIAADAWTVYKDFTIGTAKPTAAEQATVPHHLIDVADPAEGYSAAVFKTAAQAAIIAISQRGKIPILVGGAGLYIDSVLFDYSFLDKPAPSTRELLNSMTIEQLLSYAEERGYATDAIDTRNKRRIIRLIENEGALPSKQALRSDTLVIGVLRELAELNERITMRVDAMLEQGLVEEVQELAERYGWDVEPMKGVGYREFRDYFAGTADLALTRERIIAGTRRLAKKQRTWFRRNKNIHWVQDHHEAVVLTEAFLAKYNTPDTTF